MNERNTRFERGRISLSDSIQEYAENEQAYKDGMCYNNVFALLGARFKKNVTGDKVVYGFVLSTDGRRKVALRHAWLENKYNAIIDVSLVATNEGKINTYWLSYEYLPIKKMNLKEYISAVDRNNGYPALDNIDSKEIRKYLLGNGYEILE